MLIEQIYRSLEIIKNSPDQIEFFFNHPGVEGIGFFKEGRLKVMIWSRSYHVWQLDQRHQMVEIWGRWGSLKTEEKLCFKGWWNQIIKDRSWIIWKNYQIQENEKKGDRLEIDGGGEWDWGPDINYYYYGKKLTLSELWDAQKNSRWNCWL